MRVACECQKPLGATLPRIVLTSDTHNMLSKVSVPYADILIHCGDMTGRGQFQELSKFNYEISQLPHKHKLVIAGNHDLGLENDPALARSALTGVTYLQDSGVELMGLKFWGAPWQPEFGGWAFNLRRGEKLREKWDQIPTDTDVLITHGPPAGILDTTDDGEHVGCEELLKKIGQLKLKLHGFGHVHESYGQTKLWGTHFVNASACNLAYKPVNAPIVIDL